MASFSSLPPELVLEFVEQSVPSSTTDAAREERSKTLVSLSLTNQALRQPAQALLFRDISVTHKSLTLLCDSLENGGGRRKVRSLSVTRPFHEEVLIGRLSKAIRSAKPPTLSVQGHHEFNLEESLHNIQVSLLMLQSVKLLFPLKPSFVLASLRRFVLDKVEVREPHLLFRHDVLPNLRTLGPGDYYQIVVVDQDDKEEDSDYDSDDSDVDPRRELKMDTTDYPLVPQLQAFSSRSVSATIRTTAIAVLDTCFFDAEADTLPTSLRVLRLVACDEQKFEEQLTDFLYTQPPLPLLEEVHFIAYKGENEETWTSAHDWCEAQNVELHIDDPEDLSGRGDPSL